MSFGQRREYLVSTIKFQIAALGALERFLKDQPEDYVFNDPGIRLHDLMFHYGYGGTRHALTRVVRLIHPEQHGRNFRLHREDLANVPAAMQQLQSQLNVYERGIINDKTGMEVLQNTGPIKLGELGVA